MSHEKFDNELVTIRKIKVALTLNPLIPGGNKKVTHT